MFKMSSKTSMVRLAKTLMQRLFPAEEMTSESEIDNEANLEESSHESV